jgi:hypothetical protein
MSEAPRPEAYLERPMDAADLFPRLATARTTSDRFDERPPLVRPGGEEGFVLNHGEEFGREEEDVG